MLEAKLKRLNIKYEIKNNSIEIGGKPKPFLRQILIIAICLVILAIITYFLWPLIVNRRGLFYFLLLAGAFLLVVNRQFKLMEFGEKQGKKTLVLENEEIDVHDGEKKTP